MKIIHELLESADKVIINSAPDQILARLQEMRGLVLSHLTEGAMDDHRGDLEQKFDDLETKVIAARRALGMLNSAHMTPEARSNHKSKIMRHLNVFRKQLHDVMLSLNMNQREVDYHLARMGLDREFGKPSDLFKSDGSKLKDEINSQRNVASPDVVSKFSKPQHWYQKL